MLGPLTTRHHLLQRPLRYNATLQEYMAGGTLKSLVTKEMLGNGRRTYSNADALDICLQMARGLRCGAAWCSTSLLLA